eukprot:2773408-Amphidinium_carterae.1
MEGLVRREHGKQKDVTIAVRRLDGAFDSFVVVVVAPDWAEFATDALLATSYVSIGSATV